MAFDLNDFMGFNFVFGQPKKDQKPKGTPSYPKPDAGRTDSRDPVPHAGSNDRRDT